MKPRDYCCCAIPTIYVGIYLTLLEQFTLGIVAGTLSVATPASKSPLWLVFVFVFTYALTTSTVVGAATFSAAKWIFAIICYVGAAIQVLGFISVFQVYMTPPHSESGNA